MDDPDLVGDSLPDGFENIKVAKVARVLGVDGPKGDAERAASLDFDAADLGPGGVGVEGPADGGGGRGRSGLSGGKVRLVSQLKL